MTKAGKTKITPRHAQIARAVSLLFHPFLVAPLAIVLVLKMDGVGLLVAMAWSAVCAVFVVLPAVLYLAYKLANKQYTDADISVRAHRSGIYVLGGVCMAVCFGTLLLLDAPKALITFLSGGLLTLIVFGLMTRFWTKISVHVGILAAATVAVGSFSLPFAAFFAIGTLVVAWSRLTLKRHTLAEIVLGWVTASLIVGMIMAAAKL